MENTTVFPAKLNLTDINADEYENNAFVEKIKEIKYEKVIPEAIDNYVHTANIINKNLKSLR